MINVHRRKAALIMMGVPECKLLAAMRRAEGVIDVGISSLPGVTPHRNRARIAGIGRLYAKPSSRTRTASG
jgi:hypothetical protein